MLTVSEQSSEPGCRFRARVWLEHHSQQCACFASMQAAKDWAEGLHRRIVTTDVFKLLHPRRA